MNKITLVVVALIFALIPAGFSQSTEIVIVVSDNSADLAVAHALASKANTKAVIVVKWGEKLVTADITYEIKLAKPTKVIIIGGPVAVPQGIEEAIQNLGYSTTRAGGVDRFETAAIIADTFYGDFSKVAMALGTNAQSCAKAGEEAAKLGIPVLWYMPPEWTGEMEYKIPEVTEKMLKEHPVVNITITVNATVPAEIKTNLTAYGIPYMPVIVEEDLKTAAEEEIAKAEAEIASAEKAIEDAKTNVSDWTISTSETKLARAKKLLKDAKAAYEEGNYGRAYGEARGAYWMAKNVKSMLNYAVEGTWLMPGNWTMPYNWTMQGMEKWAMPHNWTMPEKWTRDWKSWMGGWGMP